MQTERGHPLLAALGGKCKEKRVRMSNALICGLFTCSGKRFWTGAKRAEKVLANSEVTEGGWGMEESLFTG